MLEVDLRRRVDDGGGDLRMARDQYPAYDDNASRENIKTGNFGDYNGNVLGDNSLEAFGNFGKQIGKFMVVHTGEQIKKIRDAAYECKGLIYCSSKDTSFLKDNINDLLDGLKDSTEGYPSSNFIGEIEGIPRV